MKFAFFVVWIFSNHSQGAEKRIQKCCARHNPDGVLMLHAMLRREGKLLCTNPGAEKIVQNVEIEPEGKFPKLYRVYSEWFDSGIMGNFIKTKTGMI